MIKEIKNTGLCTYVISNLMRKSCKGQIKQSLKQKK